MYPSMASGNPNPNPNPNRTPMYPQVQQFDDSTSTTSSSSSYSYSSLYPTIDPKDLIYSNANAPSAPPQSIQEESLITIPGAILHLIDQNYSVELANGDLRLIRLIHDHHTTLAALATVSNDVQWPLTKDLTAVKLDPYHYFFSFQPPQQQEDEEDESFHEQCCKKSNDNHHHHHDVLLSYGLTILAKGQDIHLLNKLDAILETYTTFSVRNVEEVMTKAAAAVSEVTVGEFKMDNNKKKKVEGQCAAYWTTLAPNVEEYSSTAARLIATGSGQLVKGILWCGDVTIDRLNWGNEVLKDRMASGRENTTVEIHPTTLKRIKRVKRVTKMTEKVATGVLSGVVKVSGLFTGSVANSKVGKKFFSLLPGELVLASLDGFSKICDAVEVAGKNVMSTSSTATTGLVSQRYGEEAGKATSEGLGAAGHAIGTAWNVFKIRKALNPKSFMKPTTLAKSAAKAAAAEQKAKASK